jgi:hypothetical protein
VDAQIGDRVRFGLGACQGERLSDLMAEAEAKVGVRLLFGPSAPDTTPTARPLTELLAEAETGDETASAEDTG